MLRCVADTVPSQTFKPWQLQLLVYPCQKNIAEEESVSSSVRRAGTILSIVVAPSHYSPEPSSDCAS